MGRFLSCGAEVGERKLQQLQITVLQLQLKAEPTITDYSITVTVKQLQ